MRVVIALVEALLAFVGLILLFIVPVMAIERGVIAGGALLGSALALSLSGSWMIRRHLERGSARDGFPFGSRRSTDPPTTFGKWTREQLVETRWRWLLLVVFIASGGYSAVLCWITLLAAHNYGCQHGQCAPVLRQAFYVAGAHIVACTLLIIYARSRWRFSLLISPVLLGYLLEIASWFASIREV